MTEMREKLARTIAYERLVVAACDVLAETR